MRGRCVIRVAVTAFLTISFAHWVSPRLSRAEPAQVEKTNPVALEYRIWSSADGTKKQEAAFLRMEDGVVFVQRKDGSVGKIPVAALSPADQLFIGQETARRRAETKKEDLFTDADDSFGPGESIPLPAITPRDGETNEAFAERHAEHLAKQRKLVDVTRGLGGLADQLEGKGRELRHKHGKKNPIVLATTLSGDLLRMNDQRRNATDKELSAFRSGEAAAARTDKASAVTSEIIATQTRLLDEAASKSDADVRLTHSEYLKEFQESITQGSSNEEVDAVLAGMRSRYQKLCDAELESFKKRRSLAAQALRVAAEEAVKARKRWLEAVVTDIGELAKDFDTAAVPLEQNPRIRNLKPPADPNTWEAGLQSEAAKLAERYEVLRLRLQSEKDAVVRNLESNWPQDQSLANLDTFRQQQVTQFVGTLKDTCKMADAACSDAVRRVVAQYDSLKGDEMTIDAVIATVEQPADLHREQRVSVGASPVDGRRRGEPLVATAQAPAGSHPIRKVDGPRSLTDEDLLSIAENASDVTHLNLSECAKLTEKCFDTLAQMKHLRSLFLPLDSKALTTAGFLKLRHHRLEYLSVPSQILNDPEGFGAYVMIRYGEPPAVDSGIKRVCNDTYLAYGDAGLRHYQGLFIHELHIPRTGITDEGLKSIAGIKGLRKLVIHLNAEITDKGVASLRGCESLGELELHDPTRGETWSTRDQTRSTITHNAVASLAGMELQALTVPSWLWTEKCLRHFLDALSENAFHRRNLVLSPEGTEHSPYWPATPESMRGVAGKKGVKHVTFRDWGDAAKMDKIIETMWGLPDLEEVEFWGIEMTGSGFVNAARATNLRSVVIANAPALTDSSLESLGKCRGLQELYVRDAPKITAQGFTALNGCEKLHRVLISGTQMRIGDALSLESQLKGCRVYLSEHD